MSLRLKLFSPFFLLALGLTLYIVFWWLPQSNRSYEDIYHQMLEKQLDSIGEGLVPLILSGQLDEIHNTLDAAIEKNSDWRRLELIGANGARLYPVAPGKPEAAPNEEDVDTHGHAIVFRDKLLAKLEVSVDHGSINRVLANNHRALIGTLGGGLLLFILVLGLIVEAVVRRPLGQLAEASAALADGDFAHGLPAIRQDEVGQLIVSFAAMRTAIERSQSDLRREIAERRKAEEDSSSANDRFRFLVEQSLVGFYILQDGKVVYANPYLLERIGGSEADIGKPVSDWIFPDDWPLVQENMRKRMAGEMSRIQYSFRLIAKDGNPIEVDALGIITQYNGRPAIIGVMLDITEKKHAEIALKKSEAFLRTLFDTAGEGIWVIDTDKLTVRTNRALLDMLGTSEHDMLYRSIYEFTDEENAAVFRIHTTKSQEEGIGQRYEVVLRRADGKEIHCQFNTAPLYDENGEIMGSFALVSDITERKQAEQALKRLSEDLERRIQEETAKNREKDHLLIQQSRLAAMGEMIGNIAHQWRQPLNALGLLLANIKDAYLYNELTEDYLGEVTEKGKRLVQRMSTTIDDFRNFFKPNREKLLFNPRRVLDETLAVIEASLKNNGIEVTVEGEPKVLVLGFPNEYSQVLLNIVGNAKDILLERGVKRGRIAIQIRAEDGRVIVTIADNGGGIEEAIRGKIFDPYFTTRAKGTGIGLYMSKMIIENNMNGEIRVNNTHDGAEFEIIVPMAENDGLGAGESALAAKKEPLQREGDVE